MHNVTIAQQLQRKNHERVQRTKRPVDTIAPSPNMYCTSLENARKTVITSKLADYLHFREQTTAKWKSRLHSDDLHHLFFVVTHCGCVCVILVTSWEIVTHTYCRNIEPEYNPKAFRANCMSRRAATQHGTAPWTERGYAQYSIAQWAFSSPWIAGRI